MNHCGRRALLACVFALALTPALHAAETPGDRTDNGATSTALNLPLGQCPIVINGTLGSGSPDWPSTSGTQQGRLNRNGIASTCAVPKACAIFTATGARAFDAYTFTNGTGATACVIATLTTITQAACNLQVDAYLGTFDPNSICTNYLADPGNSSGIPPVPITFSMNVPAGASVVFDVHTTNVGEIGCQYTLSFDGDCVPVELQSFGVE